MTFDDYYQEIFQSRWPKLKETLLLSTKHVARINGFANSEWAISSLLKQNPEAKKYLDRTDLYVQETAFTPPEQNIKGLFNYYLMDAASILAAEALQVKPGDQVLDMCAAPGGKALVLAQSLNGSGMLVANEYSENRRSRLKRVVREYIGESGESWIKITSHDASRWGLYEKEAFDKVLLDAPCSSERHLLHAPVEFAKWSPKRSKTLATQQFAMLAAALEAVKTGGLIVYSTCALSPLENDMVVEKLFKKREGRFEILTSPLIVGEKTKHGIQILPDTTGFGPIYYSVIKKC